MDPTASLALAPSLNGFTTPAAALWRLPGRVRAVLGAPLTLVAAAPSPARLWLRARGPAGPAVWVALAGGATAQDPHCGAWCPERTGLWTLELAVESPAGSVALVPGQVVEAMVEHPRFRGLRAYTLIPRVSGPVARWAELLPAIRAMGFNAIWLLPLSTMGVSRSPYSTGEPMSVDPSLAPGGGGFAAAEAFAEACGKAGLALGVDLVFNHVAPDGLLAATHPEWLATHDQEADGLQRSGWWEGPPPHGRFHAWRDLVRLRLERMSAADRDDLVAYWTDYALKWTALAARSAAPMVRLDNAHSTPVALLEPILPALRCAQPNLSILAEYFSDQPGAAEAFAWRHGIERLLATPWMDPFAEQQRRLLGYLDEVASTTGTRYFVPLCSHDSGSAAQSYGGAVAMGARYAVLAILGGGCTGAVQGSEWATPRKIEFIGPTGDYPKVADHGGVFAAINTLLAAEGPMDAGATRWHDANHGAILCGERKGARRRLWVVANLDATAGHCLRVPPEFTPAFELLAVHGCTCSGSAWQLDAGGYAVYAA